jgi:hypothetical protein
VIFVDILIDELEPADVEAEEEPGLLELETVGEMEQAEINRTNEKAINEMTFLIFILLPYNYIFAKPPK